MHCYLQLHTELYVGLNKKCSLILTFFSLLQDITLAALIPRNTQPEIGQ